MILDVAANLYVPAEPFKSANLKAIVIYMKGDIARGQEMSVAVWRGEGAIGWEGASPKVTTTNSLIRNNYESGIIETRAGFI